jgi:hypothetical protein
MIPLTHGDAVAALVGYCVAQLSSVPDTRDGREVMILAHAPRLVDAEEIHAQP